jgi:hypothetical protein
MVNMYRIVYKHSNYTEDKGNDETGHQECYALAINGEIMPKFGKFSEGSVSEYWCPYNSAIAVWVASYEPEGDVLNQWLPTDCTVYINGAVAPSAEGMLPVGNPAYYAILVQSDTEVDFRWKTHGKPETFNARSWEDCYITVAPRTDNAIMYLDVGVLDSSTLG